MHHSELNNCNATQLCLNFNRCKYLSIYIIVFIINALYGTTCSPLKEFANINGSSIFAHKKNPMLMDYC